MADSSPNKANGPSPSRNTRQSRRLRGETPVLESPIELKSPRKSPAKTRQRTQSQTSVGSTGSKNRRQRNTSFASSNGSKLDDDEDEKSDVEDQPQSKPTPKQNARRSRGSISFNGSNSSLNKTGNLMEVTEENNVNPEGGITDQVGATSNTTLNESQKSGGTQKKVDEGGLVNRKQKPSGTRRAPESHAELFKQAVISKDFDKFSTILRNIGNDMASKRTTIQDIDAGFVIPTLKYINEVFRDDRLRERTTYLRDFRFTIDFMEMLLQVHSGYLSTLKNLDKLLGDLIEFAEARTANVDRLNQLEGQLGFVHDQMKMRLNSAVFSKQKEETYFEDSGRHMKQAKRQADAANTSQEQMDIS